MTTGIFFVVSLPTTQEVPRLPICFNTENASRNSVIAISSPVGRGGENASKPYFSFISQKNLAPPKIGVAHSCTITVWLSSNPATKEFTVVSEIYEISTGALVRVII